MKILYRLLVVILGFIFPIYLICGVIVNIFKYIIVGKGLLSSYYFERYIDKLFKLIDYCNNK